MLHMLSHSWPSAITAATILVSGAVLLLAAGHDLLARTVPNWMSLTIALCGLAAAFAEDRLLISAAIGATLFVTMAICWRFGLIGGADVKLLGAIGLILPPGMIPLFMIAMSCTGSAHASVYIAARYVVTPPRSPRPASLLARGLRAERWRISRRNQHPYACAIAAGFVFVVWQGVMP